MRTVNCPNCYRSAASTHGGANGGRVVKMATVMSWDRFQAQPIWEMSLYTALTTESPAEVATPAGLRCFRQLGCSTCLWSLGRENYSVNRSALSMKTPPDVA
jgi:hypothetical protein